MTTKTLYDIDTIKRDLGDCASVLAAHGIHIDNKKPINCPFHDEKTGSFSLYDGGRRYKCFGCGAEGDELDLHALLEGITTAEAIRELDDEPPYNIRKLKPVSKQVVKTKKKPPLPELSPGTSADWKRLARIRNVSRESVEIAVKRSLLSFTMLKGHKAWVVSDSTRKNVQARRLDGGLWEHIKNSKAYTLPGRQASWPIGLPEAKPFPYIALVEGAPDLLAAIHFAWCEDRENEVAPVCITGAANYIPDEALPYFADKRVRIFPHSDDPGIKSALRWAEQLKPVASFVDVFNMEGLHMENGERGEPTDSRMVGDLNDLTYIHADVFEQDRELWAVMP